MAKLSKKSLEQYEKELEELVNRITKLRISAEKDGYLVVVIIRSEAHAIKDSWHITEKDGANS